MSEATRGKRDFHMGSVSVIVFDFDGVIVSRSEFSKEDAWKEVFLPYKGSYEQYFADASAQFAWGKKGDRFDIMRYVYEHLGVEDVDSVVREGGIMFDRILQQQILNEGVVPDAHAVLERLRVRYPLYVNSGTNQEGLKVSLQNLGIDQFFKGVLGGPNSKAQNMRIIAEREGIEPGRMLLVGDGEGDLRAALETECQFVGVTNDWNRWREKPHGHHFPLISHIRELEALLT